jgi:hypothetical protein
MTAVQTSTEGQNEQTKVHPPPNFLDINEQKKNFLKKMCDWIIALCAK